MESMHNRIDYSDACKPLTVLLFSHRLKWLYSISMNQKDQFSPLRDANFIICILPERKGGGEEDILFKKTFTLDFRVSREKNTAKRKKHYAWNGRWDATYLIKVQRQTLLEIYFPSTLIPNSNLIKRNTSIIILLRERKS